MPGCIDASRRVPEMKLPRHMRHLPAIVAAAAVILTACIQEITPPESNPAGTSHTVSITTGVIDVDSTVTFEVVDGPNNGEASDNDCDPSCTVTAPNEVVSWTYMSNGTPGTDTILVCVLPEGLTLQEAIDEVREELENLQLTEEEFLELINDEFGTDFEGLEELFCQTTTKTWIEPTPTPTATAEPTEEPERQRVNVGGAIGAVGAAAAGQAEENRARVAATATPAIAAPRTGTGTAISPPNTGDGGLR
jgi:hypothetical protein